MLLSVRVEIQSAPSARAPLVLGNVISPYRDLVLAEPVRDIGHRVAVEAMMFVDLQQQSSDNMSIIQSSVTS